MKPNCLRLSGRKVFGWSLFALYLAAFLVLLAPSHRHDFATVHDDCALCQVSTQPFVAPIADIVPVLSMVWTPLPDPILISAPSVGRFHFASRAPPSV